MPYLHVQLSTHLPEISKLRVFAPKPFHVVGILCGIAAFRKKAGYMQNSVAKQKLAVSTFQISPFIAVQRWKQ